LQAVLVTARAGRATLGAICGRARAWEQTLLARLIRRRPGLFAGRAFAFDRNFPGDAIITAITRADGHVVARIRVGISLPDTGQWLPDRCSRRSPAARSARMICPASLVPCRRHTLPTPTRGRVVRSMRSIDQYRSRQRRYASGVSPCNTAMTSRSEASSHNWP
jgi:hypothetical protein